MTARFDKRRAHPLDSPLGVRGVVLRPLPTRRWGVLAARQWALVVRVLVVREKSLKLLDHVGDGNSQRERRHIQPDVLDLRESGPRRRGDDGGGRHTEHTPDLHG